MKHNKIITNCKAICVGNTLLKLTILPFSLLNAKLLSKVMSLAMAGDTKAVLSSVFTAIILITATILVRLLSNYWLKRLNAQRSIDYRINFIQVFLHNPAHLFHDVSQGAVVHNINTDLGTIINCYTQVYPDIFANLIIVIAYTVYMSLQQPVIAFTLLGLGLLQLLPPLIVRKYIQINYDNCSQLEEEITDYFAEAVKGFPLIKLYGLKNTWLEKLSILYRKYYKVGNRSSAALAVHSSLSRCTENILRFGSYITLGLFILNQVCSMESGVQLLYLSAGLFSALSIIANSIPNVVLRKTAEERMKKWTDEYDPTRENAVQKAFSKIQLQDVSVSYDKNEILHQIRFCFHADQNYCIVGANGSGKSTLLYAIMKEIKLKSGTVLLDQNANYNEISADILAFVPQNSPAFSFHVDMLFLLFEDASYIARTEKIIQAFGLDTHDLSEKSISDLSGGEQKKLFLSLAFALDSQWILLDEPTNHLDEQSVAYLKTLILHRNGIILVTHDERLRSIMTNVIQIKNGEMTNA